MLLLVLAALVAVLLGSLFVFLNGRYSIWRRKGVPGPPASAFPLRVPKVLLGKESVGDIATRIYKEYRNCPVAGTYMFADPLLHIHDPEIIKQVFIKEFQDFNGRGVAEQDSEQDPLATNLFMLSGHRWRNLRVKLAPTFTSGKIKYMFETIRKGSDQLAEYLDERIAANGGSHREDADRLMNRLFVDTISSVAFGVDTNVIKDPDSPFYVALKKAMKPNLAKALRGLLLMFGRRLVLSLTLRSANEEARKFFSDVVKQTVATREAHHVERADMMSLLIQLKNEGFVKPDKDTEGEVQDKTKLTFEEMIGQVFIFVVAGSGTSANAVSFTLYELAKQPKLLEKALREADQVMADFDGKITYDAIMSMPYLEKCISETLRKYPALQYLTREAMVTRKVPLTDVVVEKGTRLVIPIVGLHYDPQYWPDPERYDPERFNEEMKNTRPAHCYLPFGDGPRICIAARLGMVQVKAALLRVLSKYSVSVDADAPDKVKMDPKSFATTPAHPLYVTFTPRKPFADIQKRS